jgi:hypothetical protein
MKNRLALLILGAATLVSAPLFAQPPHPPSAWHTCVPPLHGWATG